MEACQEQQGGLWLSLGHREDGSEEEMTERKGLPNTIWVAKNLTYSIWNIAGVLNC